MRPKQRTKNRTTMSGRQRAAITQEAARILAESQSTDFAMAKHKAANRLGQGVYDAHDLPNNQEIEQALLEYKALFSPNTHQDNLKTLRKAAVSAMKLMEKFHPRLVGPVLSGSADANSRVVLHLFSDRAEDVYMALLAKNIPVTDGERRLKIRAPNGELTVVGFPSYSFLGGETRLEMVVMPLANRHLAPISPIDGKAMTQANRQQVEALVS